MPLNRAVSTLKPELESLIEQVIQCCFAVHRQLGPGLNERIYSRACCVELQASGVRFEKEKAVVVRYRDEVLCHQRIDLLIEEQLVLEIKSVERLHPVHTAQTLGYLRLTGLRAALLVNFNVLLLKHGIKRLVL